MSMTVYKEEYTDHVWNTDRVFSHALNTVNKMRTGSQKPPSATRLKLYGLYKQAMGMPPLHHSASIAILTYTEGDVDGIMERPEEGGDELQHEREKWYYLSSTRQIANN